MLTIAMKLGITNSGGDDYYNRLLSYFKQQFNEPIVKMGQIRDSVYIVKTMKNKYVVKGYSKYKKLRLQETFTTTLHQEGFTKTYKFFPDITKEPLYFEGEYFGVMEYLEPDSRSFNFQSHKNRREGLKLLEELHNVTKSCVPRYKTLLYNSDLLEKWSQRLKTFKRYYTKICYYLNEQTVNELLDWAQWSLDGMKENGSFFYKEPFAILHGDVAHHNFLRDKSGILNLIDFDLIQIGAPCVDYIQYANRILPSLEWSIAELAKYQKLGSYLNNKAFLYALAFPTDIFREWNRVLREKRQSRHYYKYVIDLTLEQLDLRREFVKEIKTILAKM